jgi:hypothetical protein
MSSTVNTGTVTFTMKNAGLTIVKPATPLTFSEKVRALELQGRALGFLKQELEVRGTEAEPIRVVHQEIQCHVRRGSRARRPLDKWHYLGVPEGNKKEAVRGEPRTANLTGPRAVVSQRPATLVLRRQSHENYVYFFTLKKAEMVEPSLAVITAR